MASQFPLALGVEYAVPDDVSAPDAAALVRLGRAAIVHSVASPVAEKEDGLAAAGAPPRRRRRVGE